MSKHGRSSKSRRASQNSQILTHEQAQQALGLNPSDGLARPPIIQQEVRLQQHRGPVPPPETLKAYAEILPSMPERIMAMAEREQQHRHEVDRNHHRTRSIALARGQWFAFVLGFSGIVGGVILLMSDKSVAGFTTLLSTVGTLIGLFLYAEKREKQQRQLSDSSSDHG